MDERKKFFLTLGIDVVLAVLVILLLVVVRDQVKSYIIALQDVAPELARLQEQSRVQNISDFDVAGASLKVEYVDELLTKGLLLMKVILPLVIGALMLGAGFLIWRRLVLVSFWRFFMVSIPVYLIGYWAVLEVLGLLSFVLMGDASFQWVWFILSVLMLAVSGFVFVGMMRSHKGVWSGVHAMLKQWKKSILWYVLFSGSLALGGVLVALIFVLSWAGSSIMVASVLLLCALAGMSFARLKMAIE